MKRIYRIKVTRPDGTTCLHPYVFTSKKVAEATRKRFSETFPAYKHEIITKEGTKP